MDTINSQKRFYVDFLLNNWMLILVALLSGGMLIWQAKNGGGAQAGLTVADAVQKMNREKAVMVDVRDAAEYAAERIAQSKHVPLAELAVMQKGMREKLRSLPLPRQHGRSSPYRWLYKSFMNF